MTFKLAWVDHTEAIFVSSLHFIFGSSLWRAQGIQAHCNDKAGLAAGALLQCTHYAVG